MRGPMRALLAAERVMLNFLQHLGGVATLTQRFVRRVAGTRRKNLRHAEDAARLAGAGQIRRHAAAAAMNHRIGSVRRACL
jgi:nicotinate-nucleotide pyrophosphorylase (carboxylating)